LNGMTVEEILGVIDTNTYSGLQADFILSQWRKC
jgi:hypothetical protein